MTALTSRSRVDVSRTVLGVIEEWIVAKAVQATSSVVITVPEGIRSFELQSMFIDYTASADPSARELTLTIANAAGGIIFKNNLNQAVSDIAAGATVQLNLYDRTTIAGVDGGPGTDWLPRLRLKAGWTITIEDRNDRSATDQIGVNVTGIAD